MSNTKLTLDKEMIDLFFEIKNDLPAAIQNDLRLSDASLLKKLMVIYQAATETKTKTKIEGFFKQCIDNT